MLVLLDTPQDLDACRSELGGAAVGQLLTPLTRRTLRADRFGIDNGAFSRFDRRGFLSLLEREWPHRGRCLFVAAPDVVGCADRTSDLFYVWKSQLAGWPVALVAQDGLRLEDVPWGEIACLFIGGTDNFKNGDGALDLARMARRLGKWVHVGRVNSAQRWARWRNEADSCDGTGVARYSRMRRNMTASGLFDGIK